MLNWKHCCCKRLQVEEILHPSMQLSLVLWIVQRLWLVLPQSSRDVCLTVTCCFLKRPFIQERAVELNVPQCTQCLGKWRLPGQRGQQRRAMLSSAPPRTFLGDLQTVWKGLWYEAVYPVISILMTVCGTVVSISSHHRELLCVGRQVPGACAGSPREGFRA